MKRWLLRVIAPVPALLIPFLFAWQDSYPVSYLTESDWGTGFGGKVTIKNESGRELKDWVIEFDFDREITTIWEAAIVSRTGNRYVIKGLNWNSGLPAAGSVSFGFNGSPGGVRQGPTGIRVRSASDPAPPAAPPGTPSTQPPPPPPAAGSARIGVTVTETGRWSAGYTAAITLTNLGDAAAKDWNLTLGLDPSIESAWGGAFQREAGTLRIRPMESIAEIKPGASVLAGFTAAGRFTVTGREPCQFNGAACTVSVAASQATAAPMEQIQMDGDEEGRPLTALSLAAGVHSAQLRNRSGAAGNFTVRSSNPAVATASVRGGRLEIEARAPGRAAIRIDDLTAGTSRVTGIRVRNADGTYPGMPPYLSIGSVSEDSADHLAFWRSIDEGAKGKRVDIRYIYLNGGPVNGWDTWSNEPGGRAVNFIRNSRMLGMIPFFVFYNIPDGGESYDTDLKHIQSLSYMTAYFKNLKMFLDIVRRESPDDVVGILLEPDFLGYMAQNAGVAATEIPAMVRAAYESGVLGANDPKFPDNVQGLVRAINYTIAKHAPLSYFGWQMNLWASKPGGFTTSIPVKGIIRKTDEAGLADGRAAIQSEAAAITRWYMDAGIAEHGARFVSIDKYGLDAVGAQSTAADNPRASTWFWNHDHWGNYLAFVQSMRETSGLPVVLWQLPVGRINSTTESNPYGGAFGDLANTHQRFEDSAPSYFFGDTFTSAEARRDYFATNQAEDPGVRVEGNRITWPSHMEDAARAGVVSILFGAGVGASTAGAGNPPTDGYWWITKVQRYLASPAGMVTAPVVIDGESISRPVLRAGKTWKRLPARGARRWVFGHVALSSGRR